MGFMLFPVIGSTYYYSEQRMRGVAKRELIGRNCVKFVHTLCLRQIGGPEVNKFKYAGRK